MTDHQQLPVGTRVRVLDSEFDDYGTVVGHSGGPHLHDNHARSTSPHDVRLDNHDGLCIEVDRPQIEDVTPLITFETDGHNPGAPDPEWELGTPTYHLGDRRTYVVRTAHYARRKGWVYGLSSIGEDKVCMHAFPSVLRPYTQAPGLSLPRVWLEASAGCRLSDRDIERLDRCIPDSSIPDAVAGIVAGWDSRSQPAIRPRHI